jgi:hypothetical protein
MSDQASPRAATDERSTTATTVSDLAWVLAFCSAAAGVIHLLEVSAHADGPLLDQVGFATFGFAQLLLAGALLAGRRGRALLLASVAVNVAALGLWAWSRTVGLPFGGHEGIVEDVAPLDATCAALEVGAVLVATYLLFAPDGRRVGRLLPAVAGVGVLGLLAVAIPWSGSSTHDHIEVAAAASSHDALMASIDADRCDQDFNVPAYWDEADYLDVDTYQGGAMAADHSTSAAAAVPTTTDGHAHSHGDTSAAAVTTTTLDPDPSGGRGSVVLDELSVLTAGSSEGEGAAAQLVVALADAEQEDYDTWLWWLRSSGSLGHAHGAAPGDTGGHGGHVGPQPWVAMTDQDECDRLQGELAEARELALAHPTAADAIADGYRRVTSYVPGIAAHYMRFDLVDGEFSLAEPEMILYDGDGPDARVVGLSYYLVHEGDAEPSQGFTGANDHGHRHVGLCQGPTGVIGDSTLTEEECAARGGRKSDGSAGWMIHAWVVPGCESPWGVFSAASPVLDGALEDSSGTDDGACAGSAVRERYGLDELPAATGGAGVEQATG